MFKRLKKQGPTLNPFSRNLVLAGVYLLDLCYLGALLVHNNLAWFPDYLEAKNLFYGALELGPALLATCVCCGFICDFIFHHYTR